MLYRLALLLLLTSPVFAQESQILCSQPWQLSHRYFVNIDTKEAFGADEMVFVRFQEDGIAELYAGEDFQAKGWLLSDGKLWFALFEQLNFSVANLDGKELVLECDEKGTDASLVQYVFYAKSIEDTPFSPDYVKPDEAIESPQKSNLPMPPTSAEIQIEWIGGGFVDVVNPILYDYVVINNEGLITREINESGEKNQLIRSQIDREKLEDLAVYIFESGFFEWQETYSCKSKVCWQRLERHPKPIPLRLSVRFGNLKRVVSIAMYDENNPERLLNYPSELDQIIQRLRTFTP